MRERVREGVIGRLDKVRWMVDVGWDEIVDGGWWMDERDWKVDSGGLKVMG